MKNKEKRFEKWEPDWIPEEYKAALSTGGWVTVVKERMYYLCAPTNRMRERVLD